MLVDHDKAKATAHKLHMDSGSEWELRNLGALHGAACLEIERLKDQITRLSDTLENATAALLAGKVLTDGET